MAKYVINHSPTIKGSVKISGSKNSALPILAATILSDGECKIYDIPKLTDVNNMCSLIEMLGGKVNLSNDFAIIDASNIKNSTASYELMSLLRASFLVLGPLLSKTGYARISLPGGCAIGSRPVDLHLKGFTAMGAKITQGFGFIEAKAKKLKGAKIYLDFPSVGATENILMAATLADGQTIIENAAIEPEIVDLTNFLTKMGADIKGAGTDTIRINGVNSLSPTNHTVIPDRIEAGTFMALSAITKGEINILNVVPDHLKPLTAKLREIGATVIENDTSIFVCHNGKIKSTDIKTLPYPGYPTDMQAQFCSLMSIAEGTSVIIETIFENRFMHIGELKRMGANVKIEGHTAIINGSKRLTGAKVRASDLRAGAALVMAGLCAEGETEIDDILHIQRGYCSFDEKLLSIGANIKTIGD